MSYRFGESGDHSFGDGMVKEKASFAVTVCCVPVPSEPRGLIEISTVVLTFVDVEIVPETVHRR